MHKNIVILDTETTGLSVKKDRIIEIGCVKLKNFKIIDIFHSYFKVSKKISISSYKIHGITNNFLKNKKHFKYKYKSFLKFIKNNTLYSHNSKFDYSFLKKEFKILDKKINFKIKDTLRIVRKKFPGKKNSLDSLIKRFKLKRTLAKHNALEDALLLTKIFLIIKVKKKKINFSKNKLINEKKYFYNKIKPLKLKSKFIKEENKFLKKVKIT
ncbi:exonuclease domain-containing protein [Candidatus Vidania fulgoroideorum]